jgi:outer membrane protein TolC
MDRSVTFLLMGCLIFTVDVESSGSPTLGSPGQTSPGAPPASEDAKAGLPEPGPSRAPQELRPARGELTGDRRRVERHIPDPELDRPRVLELLEGARQEGDEGEVVSYTRVLERIDAVRRPEQLHLTLEEALRRTLANNYDVATQRYNPAVETTRIVEAESAFDAIFFSSFVKNKIDRPTASTLFSADVDSFDLSVGVRKLLPSGMQVSATYGLNREKTALVFQSADLNPAYFSNLALEMRQPFLRGFGLDYNRSFIVLAKNDRTISAFAFRRQVRDTLRTVEELYWRLVQARREVVITARLLAEFEGVYDNLWARRDFDITPVEIAATKSNLETSRTEFVRVRATLFDAEDQLIAARNAPDIDLADDIEIIPVNFPHLERIVVDRLAELQTALGHRPEIKEQELRIDSAKIAIGRAKNEELPRLDFTFRYTVDGLSGTADRSFDELSRHKHVDYLVGVELEVPIGNAPHRARLEHAQGIAALKGIHEGVILDVNVAVRGLWTSYDQIAPSLESAEARERELESTVARAERQDLATLNSELGARQSLASSRRAMLAALVDYNIAIIDLERAKGTLLEYNNVVIPSSSTSIAGESRGTAPGPRG